MRTASVGNHCDGDGLYLRVKASGTSNASTASWVFRYTAPSGSRRELGLGAADRSTQEAAGATLKHARRKADEARAMLEETPRRDPIDVKAVERKATGEAAVANKAASKSAATTLRRYARAYHAAHVEPLRADRHGNGLAASNGMFPRRYWTGRSPRSRRSIFWTLLFRSFGKSLKLEPGSFNAWRRSLTRP